LKLTNRRGWILLALALSAGVLAGCGTPPPCNVEPGQVEQARADYQAAEAAAQQVAAQKQSLEAEVASLKSQVVSDEEYRALEQRLEALKQGSGR